MNNKKIIKSRIFPLKIAKKIIITLVVVFIFDFFLFPLPILASQFEDSVNISEENNLIESNLDLNEPVIINNLPENEVWSAKKTDYYTITAYNSDVAQCDSSPCITANGFDLCDHDTEDSVAANFLAFGTKIRIPEIFGDKVFIVRDRMNPRYHDRLDIWMAERQNAKEFGVKVAKVEILE